MDTYDFCQWMHSNDDEKKSEQFHRGQCGFQVFKQSKKLRFVRFINIFTFFKKIVGKVLGKMTHITACLAIMNMNSTCFFLTYQPDVPEE